MITKKKYSLTILQRRVIITLGQASPLVGGPIRGYETNGGCLFIPSSQNVGEADRHATCSSERLRERLFGNKGASGYATRAIARTRILAGSKFQKILKIWKNLSFSKIQSWFLLVKDTVCLAAHSLSCWLTTETQSCVRGIVEKCKSLS